MNALVASVIRTIVPVAVGQVASWLLLAHIALPASALDGLSAFLGGALTAVYYVAVRVLEQQWPAFGVLLGLPASPDTYSKDNAAATTAAVVRAAPTVNPAPVADILAPIAATSIPATDATTSAPAVDGGFQSKIEAAISGATPAVDPAPTVTPAIPAQ